MEPAPTPIVTDNTVITLDQLLKLELAGAATYEAALEHIHSAELRVTFELNRTSHADRAVSLGKLIRDRGAEPSRRGGPWVAFSKLVERGASIFGEGAIIAVLLEGEAALATHYERSSGRLAGDAHRVVALTLMAEQRRAMARIEDLHHLS